MSQRLFVGSLSYDTMDADLKQFFEQAGAVESASIIRDRETSRSRGFGFVVMASEDDARRAISELDGKELQGRSISVSEARERGQGRKRASGGRDALRACRPRRRESTSDQPMPPRRSPGTRGAGAACGAASAVFNPLAPPPSPRRSSSPSHGRLLWNSRSLN
jgi:RNA recognition motif-containing protein